MSGPRAVVVAERPVAGAPRPYAFPAFRRTELDNGLRVISAHLPGRPLVAASLVITSGAADEPDDLAGSTVLMARALTEGTERYDAIALVEASERLGASLHADVGWDSTSVSVDVPADRLAAALDLVEEVLRRPTFPDSDVERLRDERLNDILQAKADPRRRAEDAFAGAVYAAASPYRRPAAGTAETVGRLNAETSRAALAARFDPVRMTLVVAGDLTGLDVDALAAARFGDWRVAPSSVPARQTNDSAASTGRRVLVVHRPESVQTEIRIGHPGVRRRIPEFHAVSVMSAVLGGLFNSRLNRKLREEKGYTYGAGAGFDPRRAAGPFSARAAVNTEVTVPALLDMVAELEAIRSDIAEAELVEARDYLAGVFPLRFETAGAVVGALGGLVVHDLPDDELTRYRPAIRAVTREHAIAAARAHVRPHEAATVLVGDADAFLPALEAAGFGPIEVQDDTAAEAMPTAGVSETTNATVG